MRRASIYKTESKSNEQKGKRMKCDNAICNNLNSYRSQTVLMRGTQDHHYNIRISVYFLAYTVWSFFTGFVPRFSRAFQVALCQFSPWLARSPPCSLLSALRGRDPHKLLFMGHINNGEATPKRLGHFVALKGELS